MSDKKPESSDSQAALYELAGDLHSLVNREHQIISDELEQMSALVSDAIKTLVKSFNSLNITINDQSELVQKIVTSLNSGNVKSIENCQKEFIKHNHEMKKIITTSVRSFQFEDIVQQLAVHCRTRSESMEGLFTRLDQGLAKLRSSEKKQASQIVDDMRKDIADLKAFLARENPVKQDSMRAGGIELF